jgi:hypothetical protein
MTRFLIRLGVFLCLQLSVLAFVMVRGQGDADNYYVALRDKFERLELITGPRLIIVGGSSTAFGIDSSIVGTGIHGTPVNMGIHAGLGREFYLRAVEDRVREGDTVVLMFEYELAEGEQSQSIQNDMAMTCPELRRYLTDDNSSWAMLKRTLDDDSLRMIHAMTYRAFRKKSGATGVYCRSGFNEAGDMTAHYGLPPVEKSEFAPVNLAEEDVQKFIEQLNDCAAVCHQAGAAIYFSYSPINRQRFELSKDSLIRFDAALRSGLNFPVLDRPQDYVFDETEFYDTFYHLTRAAGEVRSKRVNESLRTSVAAKTAMEDQQKMRR